MDFIQDWGLTAMVFAPLAGVAISMFWLWLTVLLVVVGAAINGESERQTVRDSTVGRERPLGERCGAFAAQPVRAHLRPRLRRRLSADRGGSGRAGGRLPPRARAHWGLQQSIRIRNRRLRTLTAVSRRPRSPPIRRVRRGRRSPSVGCPGPTSGWRPRRDTAPSTSPRRCSGPVTIRSRARPAWCRARAGIRARR
mgnify:CR=1 FL=1